MSTALTFPLPLFHKTGKKFLQRLYAKRISTRRYGEKESFEIVHGEVSLDYKIDLGLCQLSKRRKKFEAEFFQKQKKNSTVSKTQKNKFLKKRWPLNI